MEIDKIKEMLEYRFSLTTELPQKRHIIFWYDSKKEFKDLIDELNLTDVKIYLKQNILWKLLILSLII